MNDKIKNAETDMLFKGILELKSIEECYAFFDDICTIHEIQSLAQRLSVASSLKAGKTYSEISDETGASTATISRVNRAFNYGSDGYKTILGRLEKKGV